MPLAQLHHDVEEVHAVEFQLLAERLAVVERAQVFVRERCLQDMSTRLPDLAASFGLSHPETSCRRDRVAGIGGRVASRKVRRDRSRGRGRQSGLPVESRDDDDGIDAQHTERIVEDVVGHA
jgi:hypothetical protein